MTFFFLFQYIFGDFSPDEFNQFFVTPRSSVEVRQNALLSKCVDIINGHVLVLIFLIYAFDKSSIQENTETIGEMPKTTNQI